MKNNKDKEATLKIVLRHEDKMRKIFIDFNVIRQNMGLNPIDYTAESMASYIVSNRFHPGTFMERVTSFSGKPKSGPVFFANLEIKRAAARKAKHDKKYAELLQQQRHIDLMRQHDLAKNKTAPNYKTSIDLGWVYGIETPDHPGWLKIGSTINVEERLGTFQTYSPTGSFRVAFKIKTNNRVEHERAAHSHFAEFRGNGEWFRIEKALVITFLKKLQKE